MWSWRLEIMLPLLIVGVVYTIGWWRMAQSSASRLPPWRLTLALGGLMSIALALVSPLASLAQALFLAHMIQHMFLLMVSPLFLLLADPFPEILWGLPRTVRLGLGHLLVSGAPLRTALQRLTWAPAAWLISAGALWMWHLPAVYEAALRNDLFHDLEHGVFFWAGVLFWWPVINPAPHVRGQIPYRLRIVYLILGAFQMALLGLLLTMSPLVLYSSYTSTAPVWGLSPLEDQAWGGVIMWGLGGAIDMVAVLVLLYRFFCLVEHEPILDGVS